MKKEELVRFICRIISSSPSRAAAGLALQQLESILEGDLDKEGRELCRTTNNGLRDDFAEMQRTSQIANPTEQALQEAAERANRLRIQREMDARNGRC